MKNGNGKRNNEKKGNINMENKLTEQEMMTIQKQLDEILDKISKDLDGIVLLGAMIYKITYALGMTLYEDNKNNYGKVKKSFTEMIISEVFEDIESGKFKKD